MINLQHIILIGIVLFVLFCLVVKLSRVKVWVSMKKSRKARWIRFGIMKYHFDNTVVPVQLIGQTKDNSIGRVGIGENDNNAHIQILTSSVDDDVDGFNFQNCGYVDEEGYIYKRQNEWERPQRVGYTARPSKPNAPTVVGERSWKTMWLRCELNAYWGNPHADANDKSAEPQACASFTSFRSTSNEPMPPEARAAAFGLLFNKYNKQDYKEYYALPFYGWADTALLSSLIYAVLFSLVYLVMVKGFHIHVIGMHYMRMIPIFLLYFFVWLTVRNVKINSVENGRSLQPLFMLFNKSLGQRKMEWLIVACCIVTLTFTWNYYRFDFVPLCLVVLIGLLVNMLNRNSRERWKIQNPFAEEEQDDQSVISNPEGDILRNYKWELDSDERKDVTGDLTLFFDSQYIDDLRYANPFYAQRQDKPIRVLIGEMFVYVKDHRSVNARLRYLASQFRKIADRNELLDLEKIQFALDFVQEPNIRFTLNRESKAIHEYEDYIRFPDETLFDKEADSNSKAFLAAMIFHYLGFNVVFLYSRTQNHGAIGIEVDNSWISDAMIMGRGVDEVSFVYKGKRYLFCETTSDGFRIGGLMEGMSIDDFEEQVELPCSDEQLNETGEECITCLYSWELDRRFGRELHGKYTIEFEIDRVEEFRNNNPFRGYAERGGSYADNMRMMFDYLAENAERTAHVREIAGYIRKVIEDAGLEEKHLLQFALDFCQEPNIKYCVDEKSAGINYEKEYMRFPEEVLFDKEGDCDCKSSLTASLFHELGYDVIALISDKIHHAAVAVECSDALLESLNLTDVERVVSEYEGKRYLFCETTGDGMSLGEIKEGESIQDFESVVDFVKRNK